MMVNPVFQQLSLFAERMVLLLADVTVKSFILIALVFLISLASRRISASGRHLIWLLTLGAILCLPLFSLVVPGRQVRAITGIVHVDDSPLPAQPDALPKVLSSSSHIATVNGQSAPTTLTAGYGGPANPEASSALTRSMYVMLLGSIEGVLSMAVTVVWLFGFIACVLRIGVAGIRLSILRRSVAAASPEVITIASAAIARMPLWRPIEFFEALSDSAITVPLTWGFWRPVIVVPSAARKWPEERLRAALLHEIAHVERCDWLTQMLASFVCAVFWYNPFVWLASRWMRRESEEAADNYAITHGIRASAYATHLVEIALAVQARRYPPQSAVAMVRHTKIEGRIRSVLAQHRQRNQVTKALLWVSTAVTVLLLLIVSAYRFSPRASANTLVAPGEIASVPSAVEAVNDEAVLSNGVTVKLLGVSDTQPKGPTRWWTANGQRAGASLPKSTLVFPKLPPGVVGRALAISTNYQVAAQPINVKPNFTWQFEPVVRTPELDHYQGFSVKKGSNATQFTILSQSVPAALDKITLRYAVASGPWTESVTCKKTPGKVHVQTPHGEVIFTLVTNPRNLKDPRAAARGNSVFMVSDNFDSGDGSATPSVSYDRDVVGLDSEGREVCDLRGGFYQDGYGKTEQNTSISSSDLAKVSTFRLVGRPFEWVEFRDIEMQSDRMRFEGAVRQFNQAWVAYYDMLGRYDLAKNEYDHTLTKCHQRQVLLRDSGMSLAQSTTTAYIPAHRQEAQLRMLLKEVIERKAAIAQFVYESRQGSRGSLHNGKSTKS